MGSVLKRLQKFFELVSDPVRERRTRHSQIPQENLGWLAKRQGRYADPLGHAEQALRSVSGHRRQGLRSGSA
jgi:hypothetical protein